MDTASGFPRRRLIRRAIRPLLTITLTLVACGAARADDFDIFLSRFRAAISTRDVEQIADLTRLPFRFENRELDRAAYIGVIPALFDASVSRCLAKASPQPEDGAQVLFCTPYGFYLRRGVDGQWKLEDFSVDGEGLP